MDEKVKESLIKDLSKLKNDIEWDMRAKKRIINNTSEELKLLKKKFKLINDTIYNLNK